MGNSLKNKNTYTKDMLIKTIAQECRESVNIVRNIYNSLEQNIYDILSTADLDNDVSIRIFEGVTLDSSFIPEKTKVNNLTGEVIVATSKIKPKANITRSYCEKLTKSVK